jgi:ribosomal protein S18 acetylase RimI-like enzyme
MKSPITIVEGNLSDKRHCRALVALINAYRSHPMGGRLPKLSGQAGKELIGGLRNHRNVFILFAQCGKNLAGIAVCFPGFSTFWARPLLNVHDLIVSPQFRRRGIGKAIMEAAARKAALLGCCRVTLEVRADNSIAKRLYKKIGFGPCPAPMEFWVKSINSSPPQNLL